MVYERDNAPIKIRRVVEKLGTVINCMRPYDNQVGQYAEVFAQEPRTQACHSTQWIC